MHSEDELLQKGNTVIALQFRQVRNSCGLRARILLRRTHEEAQEHRHYVVNASHVLMAITAHPEAYADIIEKLESFSSGITYAALVSETNYAMGTFVKPPRHTLYDPSAQKMFKLLDEEREKLNRQGAMFDGLHVLQVVRAALMSGSTPIRRTLMPLFGQAGYRPEYALGFGRL